MISETEDGFHLLVDFPPNFSLFRCAAKTCYSLELIEAVCFVSALVSSVISVLSSVLVAISVFMPMNFV